MIICDTREKKNQHVLAFFDRNNVPYDEIKLDVGDYYNDQFPEAVVDRKQNLDELLTNLRSNDESRFWKELRRSKNQNLKLIVLCEHGGNVKSLQDVCNWRSRYSRVTGTELAQRMYEVSVAYNVDFQFCDKRSTGRRILEILNYDERRD